MKSMILIVLSLVASRSVAKLVTPSSGNCWGSTREIFRSETEPIFDTVLRNTKRTYVLCPKTYTIGTMDRDFAPSVTSVGGDYPLMFINPNVEIICQNPGTCILSGGAEHVLNFVPLYVTWVNVYLKSIGKSSLPVQFVADSSNLIIRGVTFSKYAAPYPYYTESPVSFLGPGNNMLLVNCRWTAGDTTNPAVAALTYTYNSPPGLRAGDPYYSTITLRSCTIQNSVFRYAILRAIDGTGKTPTDITNVFTLDRTSISGNTVLSIVKDNPAPVMMSSMFNIMNTKFIVVNSQITGNTVSRANADINLINSELYFEKSTMKNNPITTDLNTSCDNVQIYTGLTTLTQAGCKNIPNGGTGTLIIGGAIVVCFPGNAMAYVKDQGPLNMNQLVIGDHVLVGDNKYEPIYSFGHADTQVVARYLQLKTKSTTLEISDDHMVFVNGAARAIPASKVQIHDQLVLDSGKLEPVVSIASAVRQGAFAPFTLSGNIVVNGIKASSYIAFQNSEVLLVGGYSTGISYQWIAHTFEVIHRICYQLGLCQAEQYVDGFSLWIDVPHRMVTWWTNQGPTMQFLVVVPVGFLFVSLAAIQVVVENPYSVLAVGLIIVTLRKGIKSSKL